MLLLGIAAAIGASALYNTSIALQALEARAVPGEHALRVSLMGRLVRNRRWLLATAIGLAGWPLEIVALLLAPLTVVQPCLVSGLILLLWLGATKLGETPGRRELLAVAAIVAGVAGIAWAAPVRTTGHAETVEILLALAIVALPIAAPYALRRYGAAVGTMAVISAGCGYAWTSIASKLLTDELAAAALLAAVPWLLTALASEGLALLSEMTALQRRGATHVAPIVFTIQVVVPVTLAPLIFGESWAQTPLGGGALIAFMALAVCGTVALAGSSAVGAVLDSAHAGEAAKRSPAPGGAASAAPRVRDRC